MSIRTDQISRQVTMIALLLFVLPFAIFLLYNIWCVQGYGAHGLKEIQWELIDLWGEQHEQPRFFNNNNNSMWGFLFWNCQELVLVEENSSFENIHFTSEFFWYLFDIWFESSISRKYAQKFHLTLTNLCMPRCNRLFVNF